MATSEQIAELEKLVSDGKLGRSESFARSLIGYYRRKGYLTDNQEPYFQRLLKPQVFAEREKVDLGDLAGVNALFDKAAKHLKKPAIVLHVGYADEEGKEPVFVRAYYPDPAKSKRPGLINVKDHDVDAPTWYGRILKDGKFEISPRLSDDDCENVKFITEKLREFAAHPVEVATEFGRLTGRCCFCNLPLTDKRSTAVGYGRDCARNYGLPWGESPVGFAEPIEQEPAQPRTTMGKRKIRFHRSPSISASHHPDCPAQVGEPCRCPEIHAHARC